MPAVTPKPAEPTTDEARPAAQPKTGIWLALTNLSIGRAFTRAEDKAADIIHRGETVTLTEDQSHGFLHRHRRPVIRPATDKDPAPKLTARDLFGVQPRAAQFGAREDPPGSSKIVDTGADPEHAQNAPEAHDPQVDFSIDPDAAKDK